MDQPTSSPVDPRVDLAHDRTGMANFRTQLALDRTTLAWIRTTLTLATFGFGMVGFFRSLQEKSPSAESARLHEGAIRMGIALEIWESSRRCSPVVLTNGRCDDSDAATRPS